MIHTEEVQYQTETGFKGKGFIAYDKDISPKAKPTVMIAHDWAGRVDLFIKRAKMLAELGYVGFALDMYGNATTADTTEDKRALLNPLKENRTELIARMQAAHQYIVPQPFVDQNKIIAIGYCFGGMCVLDLARSGADILGVVSFHGILTPPNSPLVKKIKSKVLVLHGYDDPMVPPMELLSFADEMNKDKVDWQLHSYGLVKHNFTNPTIDDPELGLKYSKVADKRSWQATLNFFEELFEA